MVDIADASFLFRYLFLAGPPPPCLDAADTNDVPWVDLSDGVQILNYLFVTVFDLPLPGAAAPGPDPTGDEYSCESYAPIAEADKAVFTLKFLCREIPAGAPGETVRWTAYAALRTDDNKAGHGAQAWSLSIACEGARIVGATTDGTVVPEILGGKAPDFAKTEVVDPQADGVVSAVLLSHNQGTALPAGGIATLLAITLEAVVPQGGLGPVTLSFVDGKQGSGQPVRNVVSLDGIAYMPSFAGCRPLFPDCNRNEVDDAEDIASGTSRDCDGNGVPDECDLAFGASDCNANGLQDSCEIASGTSADCDSNGIPDECDIAGNFDCNSNGLHDVCETASGASADCDSNHIPDECQTDCNANGIPDVCDIAAGTGQDADGDGFLDECSCGLPAACQAGDGPVLELGFRGPCHLTGRPGQEREATVFAMLASNCTLPPGDGASGWTIGIASEGCEIVAATDDGTVSATVARGGLRESRVFRVGIADPARSGGRAGIGCLSVLSLGRPLLDPAGSPHAILRLAVRARVPQEGCATCTLRFEDQLCEPSGPAMCYTNLVTVKGIAWPALLGDISFNICAQQETGGRQVPGDCNQDGGLDLSDAICVFGFLFLGKPSRLPCGSGVGADPGNISLLDWQPDGKVDLSDGIGLLQFLFAGSRPHPLAVPGAETRTCVPVDGCPQSTRCH